MELSNYLANLKYIFLYLMLLGIFFPLVPSQAQGFNNNEWVFGYCDGATQRNYISFGKDGEGRVRQLTGLGSVQPYSAGNSALAIDPITGEVLFYTNGFLIFNSVNEIIQGAAPNINGLQNGRQTVAIGILDYEPDGDKIYYTFYISPNGSLLYSIVDMNNPGGAPAGQPPRGAVVAGTKDTPIGQAQGAIAVIKSPDSPSYLMSYTNGTIIAREIGNTEGTLTETSSAAFPFVPKSIVFDEDSGQLILIPEDPSSDIAIVAFDTASGTLGAITYIEGTGGGTGVEGVAISPDREYLYYSRGNQLFRIPMSDLNAEPELIALENNIYRIYDLKTGPDGNTYYIYEETEGGPQLVGRIENPDEEDIEALEVDEDPFDGTDFCGRIFPQFAPNATIDPEVDFTWEPDMPCQNNPIQLTSSITPQNYRPVSFEWSFEPALTDEDGEEIEADYNQEHFLLPEGATAQESIQVTLTVTFADGTTKTVPKTINLTQNELQANFTPQDTTVCEGTCLDIASLLEASTGDAQGGGMGGGQQPDNLEYLWSDIRTWGPKERPCVLDKPGLYWVLVRDPQNPGCTAYASIRINVWDIDDPRNNIWYFGDGAGLDFNPGIGPDGEDLPVPRPIEEPHPQQIPAGVTTISDASGQVLFYSDGETVWDANHTELATGIGGDRDASQSVLAVPVPQDETLFYLFTLGGGEAKFTVVDIKGSDGGAGFGNVTTSNNFLFSPTTDKVAAVGAGDTTWVAFHELGNNTFRFYPVTAQGIGPPVLSSLGSNHNFGTGEVGAMKFSPDGTKLAVTINDGGANRLEIFDFDPSTGALTEYALLDVGAEGNIYGLEFSNDGSRVFVSYTDNNSRVEEFKIEPVEDCFECFDDSSSQAEREECILNTKDILSSAGPFGALQIGPDGQIYVARPGQTVVGQLQVGQDCEESNYNDQAHDAMPGPSRLGLPAFVNNDGSSIPEPSLEGPEIFCLDEEGNTAGLFGGGGEPDIDFYRWIILNPSGEEVYSQQGSEDAQEIEYSFQLEGTYTVRLNVDRCTEMDYYVEEMQVLVISPPTIILPEDAALCAGQPITLTAVDPDDPRIEEYIFQWVNAAGEILGEDNTIEVITESIYTVTVSFAVSAAEDEESFSSCPTTASIFVGPEFEFNVDQGAEEICLGEEVTFIPDTPILGNWYYILEGEDDRVLIGEFYELELDTDELAGPGIYTIILVTEDPIITDCPIEKTFALIVNSLPAFEARSLNDNVDCETNDGLLEIEAFEDIEELLIEETGRTYNFTAGQSVQITELAPGNYTLIASNGGCTYSRTVTIPNANIPEAYEYQAAVIQDCEMGGGSLVITFTNGPVTGAYEITRQGSNGITIRETFANLAVVTVPDLEEGEYSVEIFTEDGCSIPDPDLYPIAFDQVDFSIPSSVTSCGPFQLIPSSNQNPVYTVLDANGNNINLQNGGYLLEAGTFTVIGEATDFCPRERLITVTIQPAVPFDLQEPINVCEGPFAYIANLNGRPSEEFIIRWRNEVGEIVSRGQHFNPRAAGNYSLEVTLRGSSNCAATPIAFTVPTLPTRVPVELSSPSSCAFDGAYITANGNFNEELTISWFLDGIELVAFEGLTEITSVADGIYSVQILNINGCILGEDSYQLYESDLAPIVLEESYTICALEGITTPLDPGEYDNYAWIFDGNIVSTERMYSPTQPGEYQLRVRDSFGCELTEAFMIIEDCEPAVRFPTAMKLGRNDQLFVIYVNEFVSYVQVLIYNRWGELIHVDETNEVAPNTPLLPWNGSVRGKNVPIGTYPVIIRYRSDSQNLDREIKRALLILE
ncbi:gliding motility-associated C-terminal domain-containing protein [Anditalea andensis]|uniref:PKD domain-containing protein n=1 Tax=Anditalea andensis TaxID=1048983 RepID=A0A074KYT5_9BACT|nr:gliding motility-associated C-terminal domain-containing protein [Anditalea andensis]KEO75111.1 hypothetical protein EL17_05415 [Anditalea andensis]